VHHSKARSRMSALGQTATWQQVRATSASLIGHSRSSAFRLSAAAVSMSLTGSCFSSETAPDLGTRIKLPMQELATYAAFSRRMLERSAVSKVRLFEEDISKGANAWHGQYYAQPETL
jgi:hypothetical protein